MESSNPTLLRKNDDVSSLRRRNKALILIFFSLIFLLALTIGAIIVYLVFKHNNDQSQSLDLNPAIREFCSPSHSSLSCTTALSYAIKLPPNANPNRVFVLSLEASRSKLSEIISATAKDVTRPDNCTSAMGRLDDVLRAVRVDPDLETQGYERRRHLIAWMDAAWEDLASCAVGGDRTAVIEVRDLVGSSRDFLVNCEGVNENFRWAVAQDEGSRNRMVEDFLEVSLFGSQYVVLVIVFCLLVKIY